MSSVLTEIVVESTDPSRAASFWSETLGWDLREYLPGNIPWISASGDPEQRDLKLVFIQARDGRQPSNRLYLNPVGCDLSQEVERLRNLGAVVSEPTGTSMSPDTPWVALVGPGGTGLTVFPTRVD